MTDLSRRRFRWCIAILLDMLCMYITLCGSADNALYQSSSYTLEHLEFWSDKRERICEAVFTRLL